MTHRSVSASRTIPAPAHVLFSIVADASLHHVIDGSGTVRGSGTGAQPLELGSKFRMGMRIVVPYVMSNTVVEYAPDRLIAWEHFGKHRWRFEFEPVVSVDDDVERTTVTETFDWSTSRSPWLLERIGSPARNLPAMERTLERLEAFAVNRANAL